VQLNVKMSGGLKGYHSGGYADACGGYSI